MPGNSSSTKLDSTADRNTKSLAPPLTRCGTWMMRDSERGARTIASPPLRPNASRPFNTTTMLSDLLRIFGNGCAGSSPSGDSTGMISSRKYARSQRVWRLLQLPRASTRTPASAIAGRSTLFQHSYCASTRAAASSWMRLSRADGASPSGASGPPTSRGCWTAPARISKNSSRLVQLMQRNLSRSSNGTSGSCAWASTRTLNASCDSSRLKYSDGSCSGPSAVVSL